MEKKKRSAFQTIVLRFEEKFDVVEIFAHV
jgi:hypothetical protein